MRVIIHHFDQNAHAIVRFGKNIEILGIYDERKKLQGRDAGEVLGMGKTGIIISGDFKQLLKETSAETLVTTGEGLYFTKPGNVRKWKQNIMLAMDNGLGIYNMSKILYAEKTRKLKEIARERRVKFSEASDPSGWERFMPFAERAVDRGLKTPRINFTGTSMNSGKLTAMFTVRKILEKQGMKVGVLGTEPCSMFLGADEQAIPEVYPTMKGAPAILGAVKKIEQQQNPDIILIGNQTGLRSSATDVKESRAGAIVAWQILLGSKPTKIVLCSKWKNTKEIRPHLELIKNSAVNAPVIANIINGLGCKRENLRRITEELEREFQALCLDVLSMPEKLERLAGLIQG